MSVWGSKSPYTPGFSPLNGERAFYSRSLCGGGRGTTINSRPKPRFDLRSGLTRTRRGRTIEWTFYPFNVREDLNNTPTSLRCVSSSRVVDR